METKTKPQIASNIIINYIAPACKRLQIELNEFIEPKTLGRFVSAIHKGKYTVREFKLLVGWKEEDWSKDKADGWYMHMMEDLELLRLCSEEQTAEMVGKLGSVLPIPEEEK